MEKNVKPIDWDADVRDKRIMRINEIIATKLSSTSKGKRESLKENKVAAKYILENWDNIEGLTFLMANEEFEEKCNELHAISQSRIEQLKKLSEKAAQEAEEKKRKEHEEYILMRRKQAFRKIDDKNKVVDYCNNDVEADHISLMVDYLRKGYKVFISSWCAGSTRVKSVVYGIVADIQNLMGNEIEVKYGSSDRYPDAIITLKADGATSEQASKPTETSKVVNSTIKKQTPKTKHEVGDLHPTKDWVWTEYKPGKFDWRTNRRKNSSETNRKERERALKRVKK